MIVPWLKDLITAISVGIQLFKLIQALADKDKKQTARDKLQGFRRAVSKSLKEKNTCAIEKHFEDLHLPQPKP